MSRLPSWSVVRLRLFAAATIASAAAISFESIWHLADVAGFGSLSILFPLTLDAVAAYGMDLWIRRSPAASQARALALVAIFGSLAANVVDHWMTQRSVLGAVLGAVPPGMLAALLAVAHRHSAPDRRTVDRLDHSVRDAVWSTLAQATTRSALDRPGQYAVPSYVATLPSTGPRSAYDDFRAHEEWFWQNIDMGTPEECWPFQGRTRDEGYGTVRISGKHYRAHRVAWSIATNQLVPDDVMVRHLKCDNPRCCNPAHLAEGTAAVNAQDRSNKLRAIGLGQHVQPPVAPPRKRAAAARVANGGRHSINVATDAEIVSWVKEQGGATKRAVMTQFGVGSPKALRLKNLAEEA